MKHIAYSKPVTEAADHGQRLGVAPLPVLRRRIVFGISAGWTNQILAMLVNIAFIRLLFRYVGREALGVWFLMAGAQAAMGLLDFGLGQTLERRIAYAKGKCSSDPEADLDATARDTIHDLLATARRVYSFLSVAVFAVLLLSGYLYFGRLGLDPAMLATTQVAWLFMCLGYAFNLWGCFVEASLKGLGDIGWANVVNTAALVGAFAINWLVLGFGGGLIGLAVVWLGRGVATRALGWATVKTKHPWIGLSGGSYSRTHLNSMMQPALHWWLAIAGYFMMTGSVRYILAKLAGADAVPDFIATWTALSAVQGMCIAIVSTGTPLYSQLIRAGNTHHVKAMMLRLVLLGFGTLTAFLCFVLTYGRDLLVLWLGPGHFVGWPVLILLSVSILLEAHQGMWQTACLASERLGFFRFTLLGGVVSIVLSLVLIPRFGVTGAAIAILVSQALTQNWAIPYMALKVLKLPFIRNFRQVLLPAACLAVLGVGSGAVLRTKIQSPVVGALALCVLLALLLFSIGRKPALELLRGRTQKGVLIELEDPQTSASPSVDPRET